MARKRARRKSRSSLIEQSLRDAQHVLSSYMESGGKQVKDTIGRLMKIFENRQLADILGTRSPGSTRTAVRATRTPHRRTKRAASARATRRRKATPRTGVTTARGARGARGKRAAAISASVATRSSARKPRARPRRRK